MIIHKDQFVYTAIPKTGTASIVKYLIYKWKAKRRGLYHDIRVPQAYEHLPRFTVVRNPYERVFSFWWYTCQNPERTDEVFPYGTSFERFMAYLIENKHYDPHPNRNCSWLLESQQNWINRAGVQYVVYLENFYQDFAELPFIQQSPENLPALFKQRKTPGKPGSFEAYYGNDRNKKQLVWQYCRKDFHQLGYPF